VERGEYVLRGVLYKAVSDHFPVRKSASRFGCNNMSIRVS
jgi:hypothetical protein